MYPYAKWKWLMGIFLLFAWGLIIFVLYQTNGDLTVETLLQYRPKNIPLTLLALVGVFLLKSVDFILNTGILFAAVGVMFPLPAAILINLIGAGIVLLVPYPVGRTLGQPLVQSLLEKHPKLHRFHALQIQHQFLLGILLRLSFVPINVSSLYMSATGFSLRSYLIGSYLGWLPSLILYTVIGMELHNITSPVLWSAIVLQVLLFVAAIFGCRVLERKDAQQS
ncbi:MAG: VTT domain-containing protein [Oscillospiraceae bacterium]|nr:VTT domain-containing protein [Oscillospiraceae bacterium]